jgi:hypothetical protein
LTQWRRNRQHVQQQLNKKSIERKANECGTSSSKQ